MAPWISLSTMSLSSPLGHYPTYEVNLKIVFFNPKKLIEISLL